MADGVTPPGLNPKSVSRYDVLYKVGRRHAVDTRQKTTNRSFARIDVLS
jgi:hypothetical protein